MDYYFSVAFYESIWRVVLALLISAILIVCFGSSLSLSLQIAAHMALLFALLMIRNAFQLAQMLADYYSNGGEPMRRGAKPSRRIDAAFRQGRFRARHRPLRRRAGDTLITFISNIDRPAPGSHWRAGWFRSPCR